MTRHNEGRRVEGGDPGVRMEALRKEIEELRAQVAHRDGLIEAIRVLTADSDPDGIEALIGLSESPTPEEHVHITADYAFPVSIEPGVAESMVSVVVELDSDDWATVRRSAPVHDHGPDDDGCPVGANLWTGAIVRRETRRRFVAANGEVTWLRAEEPIERSIGVGTRVHVDDIPDDTPRAEELRRMIRANTFDGRFLLDRSGNYIPIDRIDEVRSPEDAIALSAEVEK